jgi:hypothetical protein
MHVAQDFVPGNLQHCNFYHSIGNLNTHVHMDVDLDACGGSAHGGQVKVGISTRMTCVKRKRVGFFGPPTLEMR